MEKNKIIVGSVIVVLLGVSFYAGMTYGKPGGQENSMRQTGQRQFAAMGGQGAGQRGMPRGNNFLSGEVLSKDATSLTIKTTDGGSKIVFYSPNTPVLKTSSGTPEEVVTGQYVTVTGTANTDGSVTAQSLQLRPVGSGMPAFNRSAGGGE